MLREIYEDNRSSRDIHSTLRRKASAGKKWRVRQWLPLTILLIAFAGFGLPLLMHDPEVLPAVNAGTVAITTDTTSISVQAGKPLDFIANTDEVKSLETQGDIPLSRMLNLGVHRIVIDAGHGGIDGGTVGRSGTREKDITLAVALKLRDHLIRHGIVDVLMTRMDDRTVSLQERMDFAREAKADMFISIHVNWLPNSLDNVVETFYFGPSNDDRTLQLADRENAGSEYGLSDFMEIVERLGKTMKLQESRKLAEVVHKAVYKNARELDQDAVDTGVKKAPFVVLMGLDVPSVLAEIASMSNAGAELYLNSAENQELIAAAIAAGVIRKQKSGDVNNEPRQRIAG
jgi:N-acetylmuramoyl-L-alanine amidase